MSKENHLIETMYRGWKETVKKLYSLSHIILVEEWTEYVHGQKMHIEDNNDQEDKKSRGTGKKGSSGKVWGETTKFPFLRPGFYICFGPTMANTVPKAYTYWQLIQAQSYPINNSISSSP